MCKNSVLKSLEHHSYNIANMLIHANHNIYTNQIVHLFETVRSKLRVLKFQFTVLTQFGGFVHFNQDSLTDLRFLPKAIRCSNNI